MAPAARAGRRRHPYHRHTPARPPTPGPVLGAIDIGTHACRLLIAVQGAPGETMPRVIDSYTASVRLGEGLERAGAMTDAAVERAIQALKICADRLKRRGVTHMRAIATEACRRANNSAALIDRAHAETGIRLVIVTAEEEARLAAEGCLPLIGEGFDGALIFDIGGGSTELILVRVGPSRRDVYEIVAWASAPVGVVALAERYGGHHLRAADYPAMRASIAGLFAALRSQLAPGTFDPARYHLLGTSGTLTTLAGVKLELARYNRGRIDGQWLQPDDVSRITDRITREDFEGRSQIACIGADRADLIVPGCAILSTIMENWPSQHMRVADRGLREGLLIGLLREANAGLASPGHAPGRLDGGL